MSRDIIIVQSSYTRGAFDLIHIILLGHTAGVYRFLKCGYCLQIHGYTCKLLNWMNRFKNTWLLFTIRIWINMSNFSQQVAIACKMSNTKLTSPRHLPSKKAASWSPWAFWIPVGPLYLYYYNFFFLTLMLKTMVVLGLMHFYNKNSLGKSLKCCKMHNYISLQSSAKCHLITPSC